jgi:hypothetical protein
MSTPDFSALVTRHRTYFRTGATRSAERREGQLTALRAMMTDRAEDFHAALSLPRTGGFGPSTAASCVAAVPSFLPTILINTRFLTHDSH